MSKKILTLDNVPVINKKIGKIDTIEKLKASTIYSIGDVVEVLGFHTKGDGSHHKRIAKSEDDGSGEQGQNGIWWCIVHSGEVNVSWFGLHTTNIFEVLEKVIDTYKETDIRIVIPKNDYSTEKTLFKEFTKTPNPQNRLELDFSNSVISYEGNSTADYFITFLFPANTSIKNLLLKSNNKCGGINYDCCFDNNEFFNVSTLNTGTSKSSPGTGIKIRGIYQGAPHPSAPRQAENLFIENCRINGTNSGKADLSWDGDGIYVADYRKGYIKNCIIKNTQRQGIAFVQNVSHMFICDNEILDSRQTGIDLETNIKSLNNLTDIIITGNVIKNCGLDNAVQPHSIDVHDYASRIYIKNNTIVSSHCLVAINNAQDIIFDSNVVECEKFIQLGLGTGVNNVMISNNIVRIVDTYHGVPQFIEVLTRNTNVGVIGNDVSYNGKDDSKYFVSFGSLNNGADISNNTFKGKAKWISVRQGHKNVKVNNNTFVATTEVESNLLEMIEIYASSSQINETVIFSENIMNIENFDTIGTITKIQALTGGQINNLKFTNNYTAQTINDTNIFPITTTLDTPYYTYKMQQEGVYQDYVAYRDELHEYENSQTSDEAMLLPVLQEPEIPESVKQFAEKYKLI